MPRGQKRKGDYRYLYQRGNAWWCQIPIPKQLQARFGKKSIKRPLGTADINLARSRRWSHVNLWQTTFRRATNRADLSSEEIEIAARKEYTEIAAMETIEHNSDDANDALADIIGTLAYELETKTYIIGDHLTDKYLAETGLTVSRKRRFELREALIKAQIEGYDRLYKLRHGKTPDPPPLFNRKYDGTTIPLVKSSNALVVAEARNNFLAARKADWPPKTYGQNSTTLRFLCDHVGKEKPIDAITKSDVITFADRLRQLQPRWASSASTAGKSFDEVLSEHGNRGGTLSEKTISRHLSAVHSMFAWLIDAGELEGDNPVKVKKLSKKSKYIRPEFSDSDVCRIFEGLKFERRPRRHTHDNALPWIALIGAYSGARLEEICCLRKEDVKQKDSIWYFDIKASKTPAGIRKVPLHSRLIEAGFLDYVKSCQVWLFPSLGKPNRNGERGKYIAKRFSKHCRDIGIGGPLVGMHCWRRTVSTRLENAGVSELDAARLIGHTLQTMTYGLYSGGPSLERLNETVEQIKYEGLNLQENY